MSGDTGHMELLFPPFPLHHIHFSSTHVTDLTSSQESLCFIPDLWGDPDRVTADCHPALPSAPSGLKV